MNKTLFFIIAIVVILVAGLYLAKTNLGDVRPALLPAPQTNPNPLTKNSQGTPNVKISQSNTQLKLPEGFALGVFGKIAQARDLQFSPGGTLLVSSPNAGQIFALPDKNGDGVADETKVIINGENHPHGIAFYNGKLYIADVNRVVRYNWDENKLAATKEKDLFSLPENSDHNNHTIVFDKNGTMFVSVGSTCNVCIEKSNLSATVITADADGNNVQVFAKGLRNAPFLAFNPKSEELWSTEMGRDFLGDNLPPDEVDIIKQGQDYGWPNCYGNKVHDTNFDKSGSNPCPNTEPPIFEIPAHNAPLGLVFVESAQFSQEWQGDLLVALHGSWNRSTPDGYKVVHLKVSGNTITSSEDFITGFLQGSQAVARPVDLTFDKDGSLYLSDDKGGTVFKVIQK